ncbi:MAG: DUF3299 domain-containing protein, partial [Burkholderiales bacterium]|nr:DUF3299 domain-containing protein [Burkholderiales bacterium]
STRVLRRVFLVALCLFAGGAAHADAARELSWEQLVPKLPPYDDPFEKLSEEQFYQLGLVVHVREQKARGGALDATLAQLRKEGVDVDGLIAKRDAVRAERARRDRAVDATLDGRLIRMPGFVLPLEYAGRKVAEFLLVPWVGACIHTPPPPPNQIVHVRMVKGAEFESKGMYSAVWVTGVLAAKASKPTLNLVDGIADIDVGYSMQGKGVEAYEKK